MSTPPKSNTTRARLVTSSSASQTSESRKYTVLRSMTFSKHSAGNKSLDLDHGQMGPVRCSRSFLRKEGAEKHASRRLLTCGSCCVVLCRAVRRWTLFAGH